MAGDWIKMRGNLWDDPRVARLVDMTDASEAAVIGGLYWLWSTADQHTEDGLMPGLSLRQIDRKTGVQGLGKALCSISWLSEQSDGVFLENFEEHNGQSAKRRCVDAQRKANSRNVSAPEADKVQKEGGQEAPSLGAREREEKRREEKEEEKGEKTPPRKRDATQKAAVVAKPDDVSVQVWQDFQRLRREKRSPLTDTALIGIRREAVKAGVSMDVALACCCEAGWQGFNAGWYASRRAAADGRAGSSETSYQRSMRERIEEVAPSIARKAPSEKHQDAADYFRTIEAVSRVVDVPEIGGAT
jgi:hypothetical protein